MANTPTDTTRDTKELSEMVNADGVPRCPTCDEVLPCASHMESDDAGTDTPRAQALIDEVAAAREAHERQVAEEVATRIAGEQQRMAANYLWMPMHGWAVREPPKQDPQKRDGDLLESPWLPAFGMYASAHADVGLVMYGVVVLMPDQTQAVIEHTPQLQWSRMVTRAQPQPAGAPPQGA